MVTTLCLGCGGEEPSGKTVIKIGNLTDLTGPASPATVPAAWALEDAASYFNEQNLIPGVELEIIHYDARADPSRDIPGYEWLKGKGVQTFYCPMPTAWDVLPPFLAQDKVLMATGSTTKELLQNAGWTFCPGSAQFYEIKALLGWISDQWDYSQGKPTISAVDYNNGHSMAMCDAIRDYCAETGDFELIDSFIVPMGTMIFSGEIEKIKNSDYIFIPSFSLGEGTFVREFRQKVDTGTFIGSLSQSAFLGLIVDLAGWEDADGMLVCLPSGTWGEDVPLIQLTEESLHKHHPGDAEDIIHSGTAYLTAFLTGYLYVDIVRAAVEEVGAENFDGEAMYNAMINYKRTFEGYEEWSFTEYLRYAWHDTLVFRVSAQDQSLVRESGWLPFSAD